MKRFLCCAMAVTSGLVFAASTHADEGMWLFSDPPSELLQERYGFTPTSAWLEHVRKSCVRFANGGSASIVSANGLVMTNHHVGDGQLAKLSTAERNLIESGFLARSHEEELKCSDLELEVLWSIEDVTEKVNAGITSKMSDAAANESRGARIAEITRKEKEATGLNCDVVTLYHGGQYHLYRYKTYTDVRLVMAPESSVASFGGDTDNFEYPRYCLDVAFFRIYEDGKPLQAEHFLKWSDQGASEGDLLFITGHPARTQRLYTVDHLKFLRDVTFPSTLQSLWRREVQLQSFSARNAENLRIAEGELGGVENSRKAFTGMYAGLLNPDIMKAKKRAETLLREKVAAEPEHQAKWGNAWERIARAQRTHGEIFARHMALESRRSPLSRSRLLDHAWTIVRLVEEMQKPDEERLDGYREARLESLYLDLYSPAPIYDDLEVNRLESGLSFLAEQFGADDPLVVKALAGQSPRERAESLVAGTELKSVDARRKLAEGGTGVVGESDDAMIRLAAELDPIAREYHKRHEDEVESVESAAYADVAAAQFAHGGKHLYPDATFSLRLAFGPVKGYREGGTTIPAFTDFAGLYERYDQRGPESPYALPERWLARKAHLDLKTPYNFVCAIDIIGGNSGSPVIDREGEVVGVVFDGNIHSLVWNIAYTDDQARAVVVDGRGIIEALESVYDAQNLVRELRGG